MKDQVKEMFEQIRMPEGAAAKIQKAMAQQTAGKSGSGNCRWFRPGTVAAALAAVVLFFGIATNNVVRAAVNDLVRYVFESAHFRKDTQTGDLLEITGAKDGNPIFVEAGDGKMYFSIHGEYIDITDKTSMETPYIYTYVDDSNVEHILIIGGEPDNFGVSEFYREVVEGQQDWQGWIGGYSTNYCDNATGKAYPWLAAAWEELNLLWPMPGA